MSSESNPLLERFREAGPEADLLLSILRMGYRPEEASRLDGILDKGVDWERFVTLALKNEVLPAVTKVLRKHCVDSIPRPVLDFIEDRFRRNVRRNAVLCRELLHLNRLFERHSIQVINYKGPEMIPRIGLDIEECQFNDLDLLIRPDQEPELRSLLLSQGYRLEKEGMKGPRKDYTYIRRKEPDGSPSIPGLPEDIPETGRIIVEPHLRITEYRLPITIEEETFWKRAESIEFMGESLPVLSDSDFLLVLCLAGCKASWKNLKLINHIAALLQCLPEQSVHRCMVEAKKAGCERMVSMGLLLAHDLFSSPTVLSPLIRRARSDGKLVRYAEKVVMARSRSEASINYHPFPWKYSPIIMWTLDRPVDRVRYLWRTTTMPYPVHYRRFPLPRGLTMLYRFIVPVHDYLLVPFVQWFRWRFSKESGMPTVHAALRSFMKERYSEAV